jgi:hypothetical protein
LPMTVRFRMSRLPTSAGTFRKRLNGLARY